MGCHALLQEIFQTQGWNPHLRLLHCRQILYCWVTQPGLQPLLKILEDCYGAKFPILSTNIYVAPTVLCALGLETWWSQGATENLLPWGAESNMQPAEKPSKKGCHVACHAHECYSAHCGESYAQLSDSEMMDRWHGATPWLVERKDRHDGGQSKKWLQCIQQFLTPSFSFTSVCVGVGWGGEWKLLSHVQLFATPWTIAHQAPLYMKFSRQTYWNG